MSDSRYSDPRAIYCSSLRIYKSFDLKINSDVFKINDLRTSVLDMFQIRLQIQPEGVAMVAFRNLLLRKCLSLVSYKNKF